MKADAIFAVAVFATTQWTFAAGKNGTFEGVMSATLTRAGTEAQHIVFTRKGNLLRIENTSSKLESVNIVDLATNKLTIVYPHNATFVHVDLAKKQAPVAGVAGPGPAANDHDSSALAPMPTALPKPGNGSRSEAETTPPRIGPNPPPGFDAAGISPPPGFPPPMAQMPQMQMPAIPAGPGAGIPPMPGMFGPAELKKTDKTKKIQGFDCTLYTGSERGQNFEIWATGDAVLFPFCLIERDYLGGRSGPRMLEEQWPELLRGKSLFALEARLKMEPGGQERLSFKIDKIEKKKIADDRLFQAPEKYLEIEAPGF